MPDSSVMEGLNLPVMGKTPRDSTPPVGASVEEGKKGVDNHLVSALEGRAKGSRTNGEAPPSAFILSEGLAPVPSKLVAKILKGEFVDMAKLMRDNLEAQRRGSL